MELEGKWNNWLRKASRPSQKLQKPVKCTLCNKEIHDFAAYSSHVTREHAQALLEKTTQEERDARIKDLWKAALAEAEKDAVKPTAAAPDSGHRTGKPGSGSGETNQAPSGRRRLMLSGDRDAAKDDTEPQRRSPASSLKREGSRSQSPPKRSKAVRPTSTPTADDNRGEFDRGPQPKGSKLWAPGSQPKAQRQNQTPIHVEDDPAELIKQPETRPISQEQLVTEVKGIYAGLVMVESKCIEVDHAQNAKNDPANTLNNEQWQALIALHRTLLHEHHDFFLASQHPSASPALRRLASKYAMPARMWRHGIHSFLELLRHRLPASLEHMLTFIYLAYSMMALLYETVPAFEDTWIECLGDLGRYRMAIEDDSVRDRETWTAVSRHWYSKASDKAPTTGRLYHHLAILARPTALQQLYYYTKSLCVAIPFQSARESIMTLFDPVLTNPNHQSRLAPTDLAFVRTHGIMFSKKSAENLESSMDEFVDGLDNHIARSARRWLESGYYIALSNSCAIVGYGNESNPIYNVISQVDMGDSQDHFMTGSEVEPPMPKELSDALKLANRTYNIVLRRFGDPNIIPYLHVTLVFIYHLTYYPEAMAYVAPEFPWKLTAVMLNVLMESFESYSRIESIHFPEPDKGKADEQLFRPLPEDYAMRGLLWVDRYFPEGWFSNDKIDDDEKYFELASMSEERRERILYLGCRIAARGEGKWLTYDSQSHQFDVNPIYDVALDLENLKTAVAASSEPAAADAPGIGNTEFGELPDANAPAQA